MTSAVASGLEQALRVYDVEKLSPQELKAVLARPRIDFSSILATVRSPNSRWSLAYPYRPLILETVGAQ